jgi:hypothetical protein
VSVGDRSERLIELVRQHELYFTAQAQERPSENMRIFLSDYWTPFYTHFVGLSEPDVSIRFAGLSNELSRLRAIAAYNGIQTPDLGTAQHGYTTTLGISMPQHLSREAWTASARGHIAQLIRDHPGTYDYGKVFWLYRVWNDGEAASAYLDPDTMWEDFGNLASDHRPGYEVHYLAAFGPGKQGRDPVFLRDWSDSGLVMDNPGVPDPLPPEVPPEFFIATTTSSGATMYGPTPAFVGRCYVGAPPAKYSLVNTVPVLAPGAGGMSVKLSIDGCHLVANVCIDGKCYKGAADLTGLVDFTSGVLSAALAHWHARQHRSVDLAVPTPRGARFLDHGQVRASGWFGSFERGLKKDLKKAEHEVPGLKDVVDVAEDVEKYTTPEGLTYDAIEAARGGGRKKKGEKKHDVLHEHAQVIRATGQALVGAIAERHASEFCAGWWHDLTHSISKDVHGLEHALGGVLKQLKVPIIAAATAAASALGVPPQIAGPLASAVMNAATGSGSVKQIAQQTLATAAQNPAIAPYVAQVKQAVAQTTVAAQAAQTVADAAAGSPAAQQQIAQLASAATAGDPAAQQAMSLAQQMPGVGQQLQQLLTQSQIQQLQQTPADAVTALQAQQSQIQQPQQTPADAVTALQAQQQLQSQIQQLQQSFDPSQGDGSDTSSSGAESSRAHAVALAQGSSAQVVGVVETADGRWSATPFASSDEADDWYGGWLGIPHAYLYVAYFDKSASWPYPENEQVARGAAARSAGTAVGVGPWMPILFTPIEAGLTALLAGGAGYMYGKDHTRSAGWPALALAAGGGFAAGRWGERAVDWARGKWGAHEIAKAAKGAG